MILVGKFSLIESDILVEAAFSFSAKLGLPSKPPNERKFYLRDDHSEEHHTEQQLETAQSHALNIR